MTGINLPGLRPAPVDLDRLEQLVRCCEQRMARAAIKLEAAQTEMSEAAEALDRAIAARTDWIANNPDPQLMLC